MSDTMKNELDAEIRAYVDARLDEATKRIIRGVSDFIPHYESSIADPAIGDEPGISEMREGLKMLAKLRGEQ